MGTERGVLTIQGYVLNHRLNQVLTKQIPLYLLGNALDTSQAILHKYYHRYYEEILSELSVVGFGLGFDRDAKLACSIKCHSASFRVQFVPNVDA